MHIEEGIVTGAKIFLSYGTAAASLGLAAKMLVDSVRNEGSALPVVVRSAITTALVFCFFELLPHHAVGVSEVHLILGSTLYLIFGGGPAAVGLALGLLVQGLFFAPFDLPQYGMNVTTLLVPLWAMGLLAKRIIAPNTAYKDVELPAGAGALDVLPGRHSPLGRFLVDLRPWLRLRKPGRSRDFWRCLYACDFGRAFDRSCRSGRCQTGRRRAPSTVHGTPFRSRVVPP